MAFAPTTRRRLLLSRVAVVGGVAAVLAACGNNSDDLLPIPNGGSGTVVALGDGGVAPAGKDAASGVPAAPAGGSGGARTGATGAGGSSPGRGGASGGGAGGHAATGGSSGGGGGAPADDPCTACEKANCGKPMGFTGTVGNDSYSSQVVAWNVCFGSGPPAAALAGVCTSDAFNGTAAASKGPAAGMPKAALCQALLECIHQTSCTQGEANDYEQTCYCGGNGPTGDGGIDLTECLGPTFVPTGQCKTEIAAALEVTELANDLNNWGDACLANGAAFEIYDVCDANCCEAACGLPASGYEDSSYCNAPGGGGGGASGAGGTAAGGTGGSSGAGGATGASGQVVSGGGGSAAGGAAGTGTGGGSAGPPVAFTNPGFDLDTSGWAPSFGASISHNADDASGKAQSGSLDLTVTGADSTISTQAAASQCIAVTADATYMVGVQTLIPSQSAGEGGIGLWFYASADCSGSIEGVYASSPSANGSWQALMGSTPAPPGSGSALVRITLIKPLGRTSAEALFDNVVVTRQ